jgi:predicted Asp-tRNA(Asn)/Glu-tRNA(Gln) amidotransferase subunit C
MNRSINSEKVQREAKQILDKFAVAIEKAEKEHDLDFYVERENFERKEKTSSSSDNGFKERILENAPRHDEDFIIGEKGSWK